MEERRENLPKWFPIRSAAPFPPIGGHRGGNRRILGLSSQPAEFNPLMGEPWVPVGDLNSKQQQ